MITVERIDFPEGYSAHAHMQPEPSEIYGALIGTKHRSLRDVRRAARKTAADQTYRGPNGRPYSVGAIKTVATIRHESGETIRADI